MRIVITGINGFVGQHLAKKLSSEGVTIIGVGNGLTLAKSISGIVETYYSQDLIDKWPPIDNVDSIIHLAGLAAVGPSFEDPQLYIHSNSAIVTNICEYYLKANNSPRILIVSSGAVYDSQQPMPINEFSRLGYSSPYVLSKVLTENQADYYRNRGLDCVVVRPFNHIGPNQESGFLIPDLYSKLLQASQAGQKEIIVGNITTARDYTDVRDVVNAYHLLATAPSLEHTLYNVCSSVSLSGEDLFNELKTAMNISDIQAVVDQSLIRPTDAPVIVGDFSRIKDELHWSPSINIHQTIEDFVKQKVQ